MIRLSKTGFQTTELDKAQYNFQAGIKGLDGSIKLLVFFSKKGNKVVLQGNKELQLYPGMPAEVLIVTGKRTFFGYLLDPIKKTFNGDKEALLKTVLVPNTNYPK